MHVASGRRYVGSAVRLDVRWAQHRRALRYGTATRYLQHAWTKHGADAFRWDVLLYCAGADLLFYEQRALDCYQGQLYNLCLVAGSQRGRPWSQAAKDLRRARAKSKRRQRGNARLKAAWAARPAERVAALREAWADPDKHTARVAKMRAKWTPERAQQLDAARTQRRFTPEWRTKAQAALTRARAVLKTQRERRRGGLA